MSAIQILTGIALTFALVGLVAAIVARRDPRSSEQIRELMAAAIAGCLGIICLGVPNFLNVVGEPARWVAIALGFTLTAVSYLFLWRARPSRWRR